MIRIDLNRKWIFTKDEVKVDGPQETEISWEAVDLPHTWNAKDGQDGGNDYYRGTCWYGRTLEKNELPEASGYYLEFAGANASADVYINGQMAAHHDGGYSTWRVDMTPYLQEENLILVAVDNSPSNKVYPQMADFTFYGGLYRSVSLLAVEEAHFQLDHFGGPGVKITPVVDETKV